MESSSEKTAAAGKAGITDYSGDRKTDAEIAKIKKDLVEAAGIYQKSQNLAVGERKFNMDCSGVVSALYYYAGIDLQKYYPQYSGTGTERIYKTLDERKLLKNYWLPEPGDLIFWDNTYDKNNNGRDDDELTHVGMVVSCDKQGNIVYIHHHYSKGIVFEKMNLRYKNFHSRSARGNIITINSPLRIKGGSREQKNWLSGQLFNSFGEGYHL
jgi:cell wall-associated NlpC family hydrolase